MCSRCQGRRTLTNRATGERQVVAPYANDRSKKVVVFQVQRRSSTSARSGIAVFTELAVNEIGGLET